MSGEKHTKDEAEYIARKHEEIQARDACISVLEIPRPAKDMFLHRELVNKRALIGKSTHALLLLLTSKVRDSRCGGGKSMQASIIESRCAAWKRCKGLLMHKFRLEPRHTAVPIKAHTVKPAST